MSHGLEGFGSVPSLSLDLPFSHYWESYIRVVQVFRIGYSSSSRIGFRALALGNFTPFTVHVLSQFVVNIAVSTSALEFPCTFVDFTVHFFEVFLVYVGQSRFAWSKAKSWAGSDKTVV